MKFLSFVFLISLVSFSNSLRTQSPKTLRATDQINSFAQVSQNSTTNATASNTTSNTTVKNTTTNATASNGTNSTIAPSNTSSNVSINGSTNKTSNGYAISIVYGFAVLFVSILI